MGNQESIENLKQQLQVMEEEVFILKTREHFLIHTTLNDFVPKNPKANFETSMDYVKTIKDLSITSITSKILKTEEVILNMSESIETYEASLKPKEPKTNDK